MPFKSEKQKDYLKINKPDIYRKFKKDTMKEYENSEGNPNPGEKDNPGKSNIIYLGEGSVEEGMQAGDEVEMTVAGKLVEKPDGSLCLKVMEANGVEVRAHESEEDEEREGDMMAEKNLKDMSDKMSQRNKMY